jgi:hypothetical protein
VFQIIRKKNDEIVFKGWHASRVSFQKTGLFDKSGTQKVILRPRSGSVSVSLEIF